MDMDNKDMKAKIAFSRSWAIFALVGALICMHHSYAATQLWQQIVWGIGTGLLCSITINCTVKASVLSSALVLGRTIELMAKKGMFQR